jgi:hypothetical protein
MRVIIFGDSIRMHPRDYSVINRGNVKFGCAAVSVCVRSPPEREGAVGQHYLVASTKWLATGMDAWLLSWTLQAWFTLDYLEIGWLRQGVLDKQCNWEYTAMSL